MSYTFRGKAIELPSKLYINGEWIETETKLPVYSPELGKDVHAVSQADVQHVNASVEAARACVEGPNWGINTTGAQRAVFIREIARIIEGFIFFLWHKIPFRNKRNFFSKRERIV